MKTALLIFLIKKSLKESLKSSYEKLFSSSHTSNKYLKNSYYRVTDPSFELQPAAIKFAWQIRAINQFLNPVAVSNGNSEVLYFALNKIPAAETTGCKDKDKLYNSVTVIPAVTGGTALYIYNSNFS